MDADLVALRAAAGLANLAVAAYTVALGLDAAIVGDPAVRQLLTAARGGHAAHAAAFNTAAVAAGGAPQTEPDPAGLTRVRAALPALQSATAVLELLAGLEDNAERTYTTGALTMTTPALRLLMVSTAAVVAQRRAALAVLGALPADRLPLGPDLTSLPPTVGTVGLPAAFAQTAAPVRPATG